MPILLSKKTIKGEGGGHNIGKMGRRRLWMAPNGKPLSLGKVETKIEGRGDKKPKKLLCFKN